jgi:hypothetical protein
MLRDLGAYLTLEKAQRSYGFDAAKAGLTEAKAAEIAVVFSRYDSNDDGVLSLDEFKRLWWAHYTTALPPLFPAPCPTSPGPVPCNPALPPPEPCDHPPSPPRAPGLWV